MHLPFHCLHSPQCNKYRHQVNPTNKHSHISPYKMYVFHRMLCLLVSWIFPNRGHPYNFRSATLAMLIISRISKRQQIHQMLKIGEVLLRCYLHENSKDNSCSNNSSNSISISSLSCHPIKHFMSLHKGIL